jgi:hypothetical protein
LAHLRDFGLGKIWPGSLARGSRIPRNIRYINVLSSSGQFCPGSDYWDKPVLGRAKFGPGGFAALSPQCGGCGDLTAFCGADRAGFLSKNRCDLIYK